MNDGKGLEPDPFDLARPPRRQHVTELSLDREMADTLPGLFGRPHRAWRAGVETEGMIWMCVRENYRAWIDPKDVLTPSFPAVDHDGAAAARDQCRRMHSMAPILRGDVAPCTEKDDFQPVVHRSFNRS